MCVKNLIQVDSLNIYKKDLSIFILNFYKMNTAKIVKKLPNYVQVKRKPSTKANPVNDNLRQVRNVGRNLSKLIVSNDDENVKPTHITFRRLGTKYRTGTNGNQQIKQTKPETTSHSQFLSSNKKRNHFLSDSSDDEAVDCKKMNKDYVAFIRQQNDILIKEIQQIQEINEKRSQLQKRKLELMQLSLKEQKEANRLKQIKIELLKKQRKF